MRDSTGQDSSEITAIVGTDAGPDDRGEDKQQDHRWQRHGKIDEAHDGAVDHSGH